MLQQANSRSLSTRLSTRLSARRCSRGKTAAQASLDPGRRRWSAHAILPNLRMAVVKTSESGLPNARGTAVYDRMPAPRACSAPQHSGSPICRLLHRSVSEPADAVLAPSLNGRYSSTIPSLSLSLLLSLYPGWRRLLLSAAWESEA